MKVNFIKTSIPFLLLSFLMLGTAQTVQSQNVPGEGTLGIQASIQSGQSDLLFPYRLSSDLSIAPLIGFNSVEDQGSNFRVGVKPQFYRDIGSNFATYIGGLGIIRIDSNDSDTSFVLGFNGGGEYYLSNRFSLGVEGQINLTIDDRNAIGTGAAVAATYYFN
jgi:hypothetical protein